MHRADRVGNAEAEADGPDGLAGPVNDPSSIWREARCMDAPGGDELPRFAAQRPHDVDAPGFALCSESAETGVATNRPHNAINTAGCTLAHLSTIRLQ